MKTASITSSREELLVTGRRAPKLVERYRHDPIRSIKGLAFPETQEKRVTVKLVMWSILRIRVGVLKGRSTHTCAQAVSYLFNAISMVNVDVDV